MHGSLDIIKDIRCVSNCSHVVEVLPNYVDVSTFWAKETFTRIRALISKESTLEICQVSREKNNVAYFLARQALL